MPIKDITGPSPVKLTNGAASSVTFQNIGDQDVIIFASAGDTAVLDEDDYQIVEPKNGREMVALSDLFPEVAGADTLYAYSEGVTGKVWINQT